MPEGSPFPSRGSAGAAQGTCVTPDYSKTVLLAEILILLLQEQSAPGIILLIAVKNRGTVTTRLLERGFFMSGMASVGAAQADSTLAAKRQRLLNAYMTFAPNPKNVETIVQLREGAPGAPKLFFCPATDGTISYLRNYIPYLPADWAFYGCQTPGLEGERAPFRTIEEIAAYDVEKILKIQPEGPFHIGGFCNGGLVAYEICKILKEKGHEVALCLDLLPLFPRQWTDLAHLESPRKRVVQDFMFVFEEFLGNSMADFPVEKVLSQKDEVQIETFLRLLREHGYLQNDQEEQLFRHRVNVYNAGLEAMLSYKPQNYMGVIDVIAAGEEERYKNEIQVDSPYATHLCVVQSTQKRIHYVDVPGKTFVNGHQPELSKIGEVIRSITARAGQKQPARSCG
jgi:thioesterase domain-containing protein